MPDDDMDISTQTADMMEADQAPPPPQVEALVPVPNQPNDKWKTLLTSVRKLIDQGKPSHALQALVMTMREHGGEGAVAQMLKRAHEIYHDKIQANAVADELASLFAECAIAENMMPSMIESPNVVGHYTEPDEHGTSILDQMGKKQIVMDAFADGSSFVCFKCGGLVSILRKDEHDAYWCCRAV
ncbi:uncharacterized protein LOC124926564 [Impatiens glandulifera]|uniref:uncharacterized protein LOC124926564 n=1 Tax=Impatiens glandulifera TaxID=253017 RepID=UPI001FB1595A|nr:uncharacterized protein LOC124926564 [Impatiens glandulifera]